MTTTEANLHHRIGELELENRNLRAALELARIVGTEDRMGGATLAEYCALQGPIKISRTMWDKMLAAKHDHP